MSIDKQELWPNLLIIGAVKSGTGSLWHYLRGHPEVFMSSVKEAQFFSGGDHQYASEDNYLSLFKDKSDAKVWGESTGQYMMNPQSCPKIYEHLGERVKLVCVLRNPAKSIYSLWGQTTKMLLETRPAERAILDSFSLREWDPQKWHLYYAWAGNYAAQLTPYFQTFPRSQIKVFFFEEFFQPGFPQFGELCRFLGVSEDFSPQPTVVNKGYIWKSNSLNTFIWEKYLKNYAPLAQRFVSPLLRTYVRNKLEKWNQRPLPAMKDSLYDVLKKKYDGSVRELETLVGRSLSDIWF